MEMAASVARSWGATRALEARRVGASNMAMEASVARSWDVTKLLQRMIGALHMEKIRSLARAPRAPRK
jgi:hypothetical protein